MAQQSHVPKFGNWESENIAYTTHFENARKEKGTGVKKFNPNDPEENPDAFIFGTMDQESDDDHHHHHHVNRPPPSRNTSDRNMRPVARYKEEHSKIEEGAIHHNPAHHLNVGRRKSIHSESSSSEKSSSDYSLLQQHHLTRSNRKKSLGEGSNNFGPPSPPTRMRNGTHRAEETHHHKAASVPKFGAWDEKDPKSGEGFTIIFNKVKEEKQMGATKFPPIPSAQTNFSKGSSSPKSKKCCCLF